MINMLAIALGAAVGANLRYGLSVWAAQRFGTAFPYGTLIVNVLGSFVIGLILGLAVTRLTLSTPWRLLLVTGLLGGFTTFSSFSYETYDLIERGAWLAAGGYVLSSVGFGLLACIFGIGVARLIPN
ncbi:MAG: fluoride efflux transporter CrcB [Chloroflexales bacterium]|nr:fluoride efflux transporter CrcB [Chloroflexales bacterium]